MWEIGTPKMGLHEVNLYIKKTKDCCKIEDMFQKKAIFQSHIHKIADKKTTYNKGRLYLLFSHWWCFKEVSFKLDRFSENMKKALQKFRIFSWQKIKCIHVGKFGNKLKSSPDLTSLKLIIGNASHDI